VVAVRTVLHFSSKSASSARLAASFAAHYVICQTVSKGLTTSSGGVAAPVARSTSAALLDGESFSLAPAGAADAAAPFSTRFVEKLPTVMSASRSLLDAAIEVAFALAGVKLSRALLAMLSRQIFLSDFSRNS